MRRSQREPPRRAIPLIGRGAGGRLEHPGSRPAPPVPPAAGPESSPHHVSLGVLHRSLARGVLVCLIVSGAGCAAAPFASAWPMSWSRCFQPSQSGKWVRPRLPCRAPAAAAAIDAAAKQSPASPQHAHAWPNGETQLASQLACLFHGQRRNPLGGSNCRCCIACAHGRP